MAVISPPMLTSVAVRRKCRTMEIEVHHEDRQKILRRDGGLFCRAPTPSFSDHRNDVHSTHLVFPSLKEQAYAQL